MSGTWVVIPVYNEASVIGSVIKQVKQVFPNVVCVIDGGTDNSAEEARKAGAVVVEHPINLGQGASLQTGFDYALSQPGLTEVVTFDADGQHLVSDAKEMVDILRLEKLDIVIGSRFLDDRTKINFLKRAVLKTAAFWTKITTRMALTDAHNGLRIISAELLTKIHLHQNRMAHASELIDQVAAENVRWKEYPTHIIYTDYSKAKGQSLLNAVNIVFELLFK
ncbi:MAG: glycosyltransferase family 2 protein [Microbacteriaceae bacterium]|nr:glycosyltransferase family 2 protein [Microbacteriaceae bacterium]